MRCLEFASIPKGIYRNGSTMEEIQRCLAAWTPKLLDSSYTEDSFRSWILKEFPNAEVETEAFEISRYPVTNADYEVFLQSTNAEVCESIRSHQPSDHPAWGMRRQSAEAFCQWLSEHSGSSIRLPFEMEWEIAARGPKDLEYPYGEVFDPAKANTYESGWATTTPVDYFEKFSSGFDVVDMAGNVEEWVQCDYAPYPGGTFIEDDLVRVLGSKYPILRGGSFARGGDLSRSARRHGPYPSPEFRFTGFRLVRVQAESQRPSWRDSTYQHSTEERSISCTKLWKAAVPKPESNPQLMGGAETLFPLPSYLF